MMRRILHCVFSLGAAAAAILLSGGCGKKAADAESGLTKIIVQTDWYAQGEHGGFYQALAAGYYKEAGLDVTISQGGPGSFGVQKVATGQAQFTIGRADDFMMAVQQGLPILIVSALMQHDPQALLLHEENPVSVVADLQGKSVMTTPGAVWVRYLKARHGIDISVIPLNYGLAQFMADKNFIQQCFVTNEPYYVIKNGGKPKTIMFSEFGYDPYRVIVTNQVFAREQPEAVRAFVAATARGWVEFLHGDNAAARALITNDNEKMTDDFTTYSINALKERKLVEGDPAKGEFVGLLTPERLQDQVDAMVEAGMIKQAIPLERFVSFDFLPPAPTSTPAELVKP